LLKRPGKLSWHNLFYAAPIGAPGALVLAGIFGEAAIRLERRQAPGAARRDGLRLGLVTSTAIMGTVGEVALLHFRGAFHNPAMVLPVTIPPAAAAALEAAVARPSRQSRALAGSLLGGMAAMALAGIAFHAYGVARNRGGWRNWTQNLFQGPPLSAPPSFAGLALAGFAALRLVAAARARR
jgi:hypothetical protein